MLEKKLAAASIRLLLNELAPCLAPRPEGKRDTLCKCVCACGRRSSPLSVNSFYRDACEQAGEDTNPQRSCYLATSHIKTVHCWLTFTCWVPGEFSEFSRVKMKLEPHSRAEMGKQK